MRPFMVLLKTKQLFSCNSLHVWETSCSLHWSQSSAGWVIILPCQIFTHWFIFALWFIVWTKSCCLCPCHLSDSSPQSAYFFTMMDHLHVFLGSIELGYNQSAASIRQNEKNKEGKMDSPHPDYMHVSGKHGSERRGLFAVSSLSCLVLQTSLVSLVVLKKTKQTKKNCS